MAGSEAWPIFRAQPLVKNDLPFSAFHRHQNEATYWSPSCLPLPCKPGSWSVALQCCQLPELGVHRNED